MFTSTDLATGAPFRISRDFVGSFYYGYATPPPSQLQLSSAVAASAAFPGAVAVVRLKTEDLGLESEWRTISLVDGGVFDNLGLEFFLARSFSGPPGIEAPTCDFLIFVNASGRFRRKGGRYGAVRVLLRSANIQYAQTIIPRIRAMVGQMVEGQRLGAYVGIADDPRRMFDATGAPVGWSVAEQRRCTASRPSDRLRPVLAP